MQTIIMILLIANIIFMCYVIIIVWDSCVVWSGKSLIETYPLYTEWVLSWRGGEGGGGLQLDT